MADSITSKLQALLARQQAAPAQPPVVAPPLPQPVQPSPTGSQPPVVAPPLPQPSTPATPATPAGPAGPQVVTYGPETWNNLPVLSFLRRDQNAGNYLKLGNQGTVDPKLGTSLPAPNQLNFGDLLRVYRDPTAWGVAESAFKSANRDLSAELALAAQYAPRGNAMSTNQIRTG